MKGHDDLQVELCKEQVAWARQEKRTFLRHRVELRLSALYLEMRAYQDALKLIEAPSRSRKKGSTMQASSSWTSTCSRARSTTPCATCPR